MALNAYARVHGHKNKPEFALAGKCAILRVGVKQNKCFQSVCECGRLYGCWREIAWQAMIALFVSRSLAVFARPPHYELSAATDSGEKLRRIPCQFNPVVCCLQRAFNKLSISVSLWQLETANSTGVLAESFLGRDASGATLRGKGARRNFQLWNRHEFHLKFQSSFLKLTMQLTTYIIIYLHLTDCSIYLTWNMPKLQSRTMYIFHLWSSFIHQKGRKTQKI